MALSAIDMLRSGGQMPTRGLARPRRRNVVIPQMHRRQALRYTPPENRIAQRSSAQRMIDRLGGSEHHSGWGSILPGISHSIEAIPIGLAKASWMAGKQAAAPIRAGIDVLQGDLSVADAAQYTTPQGQQMAYMRNPEQFQHYMPLTIDVAQSAGRTAGNLRHPTHYQKAWREGTIVDTVLEDAGNLSIVGGAIGKGLTAGSTAARTAGRVGLAEGLETAGRGVTRVAKLGGATSDLPTSVWRKGGEGLGKLGIKAGETARTGAFGSWAQAAAERAPQLTTEVGRFLKAGAKDAELSAKRAGTHQIRRLIRGVTGKNKLTTAEQGAATALRTNIGRNYMRLIDQGVDPVQARHTITLRDIDEQTFTPEAAYVTRQYMEGTLDPETRARMDEYLGVVDDVIKERTSSAIAGEGRRKPLDPAQLGDDALQGYVDDEVRKAGYDPANMAAVPADVLEDILNDPANYPSAWRPSMRSAALARQAQAEGRLVSPLGPVHIPLRPADQLAAGATRPGYVPGGRSDLTNPKNRGIGRTPLRAGIRGTKDLRSEKMRVANDIQAGSARTIGERIGEDARMSTMNKKVVELFSDKRVQHVPDVMDPAELAALHAQANREATAQVGRDPSKIAEAEQELYGKMLMEELDAKGYEVLVGDVNNWKDGDFNPEHKPLNWEATDSVIVLPKGMKDRLTPYMVGKDFGLFMRTLEKINTKFKGLALPFSARWQLGDLVGGAFMSWMGGGIDPVRLARGMMTLDKLDDKTSNAIFDRPDFMDSGLNAVDNQTYLGTADPAPAKTALGRGWHKAGGFRRGSFRVNSAINRINRQGYVLAKVDAILKKNGVSSDLANPNFDWSKPEVQGAINDAIGSANEVMGTFDEMSPFERRVVRNVFPFYAWSRHITGLALKTAIDNPARMMWTMNLGAYGAEGGKEELPWLKGAFEAGGQLWPTGFVNPLNDVMNNNMYTPEGAIKASSPGIKILAAQLGYDANNGLSPLSRPYDGGGLDDLGRAQSFRFNLNPIELGYHVARQFPQSRAALNLLPTNEVAGVGLGPHPRYDSGALMVDKKGQPFDTNSRRSVLGGLLGLPWPTSVEDKQAILETTHKRRKAARARALNTVRYQDDDDD